MSKLYKKINKFLKYIKNVIVACALISFDFLKKHKYISLLIIILLIGFVVYYRNNFVSNSNDIKNVPAIVQKVGKLMSLPTNETPTLFEIADPKFLATKEPFFNGAIKGDVLVIYQKSGKAIIYSPSRNIIVNAGPLVNSN